MFLNLYMKITIITPVKNNDKDFFKTLTNLNKFDEDFDYIVINGGNAGDIEAYLRNTTIPYTLIPEKDDGISDAFNKGVKLVSSGYVLILNAGDCLLSDAFDSYYKAFKQSPDADIFYGDLCYHQNNRSSYVEKADFNNIWKFMSIYHPGMLVKKSAYEKVGGYDLNYHYAMDSEWVHRAIRNGLKFHYIPHVLSKMALGGKSDKYFYKKLWFSEKFFSKL